MTDPAETDPVDPAVNRHDDDTAARPGDVEPDPRTDGVGYEGHGRLGAPSDEEIAAGMEHDKRIRGAAVDDRLGGIRAHGVIGDVDR